MFKTRLVNLSTFLNTYPTSSAEMSLTIRLAKPTDTPAVEACARLAYQPYVKRMQQKPAPMIANFTLQISDGFVWVAIKNNSIAGYVVFYPLANSMHLENVAVLPSMAGMGIGKQLIEHVEQQACAQNIYRLELYTNEMMHENINMYVHLGFTEIERRSQGGFNRVFFEKRLTLNDDD